MTAAHFDAHFGPGPDIPDGPPDHILLQELNKVTANLLELTQVTGLDFLDLLVTDAPEKVFTQGLVRATCRPCDLHVARDHSCPRHRSQNNGQLLPGPLDLEIDYKLYNAKFCLAPKVYMMISSRISLKNAFKVDL